MRVKSRVIGAIGIISLLPGLLLLISPYSYEVGGGCRIYSQGVRLCALPVPELNYAIFVPGLLLTILGTVSMAVFLYRRWWRDNPTISESEMHNTLYACNSSVVI